MSIVKDFAEIYLKEITYEKTRINPTRTYIVFLFSACSASNPENAVKSYLSAYKNFNQEKMDKFLLETGDRAEGTTNDDDKDDEYYKPFEEYIASNASKLSYDIIKSEVDGAKAVVTVDFKYVDGSDLFEAVMDAYMQKMFDFMASSAELPDGAIAAMLSDLMKEEMKKTPEVFEEATLQIECVRKDRTWYIEELSDEVANVLSSGLSAAMEDIGNNLEALDIDSDTAE